jgi:hypothetical protein
VAISSGCPSQPRWNSDDVVLPEFPGRLARICRLRSVSVTLGAAQLTVTSCVAKHS